MRDIRFDYELFYNSYKQRSILFVRSYLRDELITEDIVSDAFVKLWEISQDTKIDTPEFLLFRILKNKCLDALKHKKMKEVAISNLSDIDTRDLEIRIQSLETSNTDSIFTSDIKRIINKTLKLLPPQTRNVFQSYKINGCDKQEVAEQYHISTKGVDYHIAKAMGLLKKTLADYLPIAIILLLVFFN